jgi:hypothetical protein
VGTPVLPSSKAGEVWTDRRVQAGAERKLGWSPQFSSGNPSGFMRVCIKEPPELSESLMSCCNHRPPALLGPQVLIRIFLTTTCHRSLL